MRFLPALILLIGLFSIVDGQLTIISVPRIAPNIPTNILISFSQEVDTISDFKITVYNHNKTQALPEYTLKQGKEYLAKVSKYEGRYVGYFSKVPKDEVTLKFESKGASTFTDKFHVKKELTIAYFRPIEEDKVTNDKLETFVKESVNRLNEGKFGSMPFQPILDGWNINLQVYPYSAEGAGAENAYRKMKDDAVSLPPIASILGLGSNKHTEMTGKEMIQDGYAVTSFRKDVSEKLKDSDYKYLNRLELPEDIFLNNVFKYIKDKGWTGIIILQTTRNKFNTIKYAEKYGVEVTTQVIDGYVSDGQDVNLDSEFESIKSSGRKIILTTATANTAKNLLKYANKHKVTSSNGYQWIGLNNIESLRFLNKNSEEWCIDDSQGELKLGIMEFKGTIVFSNTYYHMFNTTEGEYMWRGYLNYDTLRNPTQRSYLDTDEFAAIGSELALAYDALKVNVLAFARLIYADKALIGEEISAEIRKGNVVGLSGPIKLDSNGIREEFHGTVHTLWPMANYLDVFDKGSKADWAKRTKSDWHLAMLFENNAKDKLVFKRVWSPEIIKRFLDSEKNGADLADFQGLHRCRIPNLYWAKTESVQQNAFNEIDITYCKGKLRAEDYLLEVRAKQYFSMVYKGYTTQDKPWFSTNFPDLYFKCEEEILKELNIPSFYCSQGCGDIVNKANINTYSNGQCVSHGKCQCSGAWSGHDCRVATCNGIKSECPNGGKCVAPETCACTKGWSGKNCTTPVCDNCDAVGGQCNAPGLCECKPGYFGKGDGKTKKMCWERGTCVQENAGNNGKVNPFTGNCITCKPGYFSPSSDCKYDIAVILGVTAVVLLLFVLGAFLAGKLYVAYQKTQQMMKNNDWILNWDDIKIADKTMSQKSSMMISAMSMNMDAAGRDKQFNVGTYDGMEVYYQKLDRDSIVLDNDIRAEVNEVRDLKHTNICIIMGCCIAAPNVAIITELQPKGSLEDLFGNEEIKLPWNFKFGLIKGIISGLTFLSESKLKHHGRLKTSNVLVDNRWTVKLTGIGMKSFKSGTVASKSPDYASLLWTAPELIRSQNLTNLDGLVTGADGLLNDIYGLGVLLSEFCTRDLPYSEVMLEKEDMIHLITGKNINHDARKVWDEFVTEHNLEMGGIVRPLIRENQWPKKYEIRKQMKLLMEQCWAEDPTARPSLADIKSKVDTMDPRKGELIEHLVSMLEQYSNNLEHIVTKRTTQLTKESQRTEDLVSRLLPKSVSEALKAGGVVEPETFEFTSIYFSDIVGFTSIAKASTPFEVVALLNNMYTLFDGISARHDVYKVETIGDAYMIVSGLPTRNGDRHAGEICTTALELMCAIGSFVVPHMPDTKLRLRSGVHTGNVVAGVVGLKMPRYCLFGDSVNVASEMESGGKPSRVQISSATQTILERLGGYHVEYRDEIESTKGGKLGRYFLNGKDHFTSVMPAYDIE